MVVGVFVAVVFVVVQGDAGLRLRVSDDRPASPMYAFPFMNHLWYAHFFRTPRVAC